MGASTYTRTETVREVFGNKQIVQAKYAITTYGTDGIPITPAAFNLDIIDHILGIVLDVACDVAGGAIGAVWDPATGAVTFNTASNAKCAAGALVITAYVTVMGS